MSPTVTGTASAPGLARSRSAMCGDSSIPLTGTPRALSGSATRPVPTANSSAGPSPASAASTSTHGSSTAAENMSPLPASYDAAISGPHSCVAMAAILPRSGALGRLVFRR